ncbi:hypothetical protein [Desulfonema magnum]|uniref:Uncharacterized protein n=1 Tax=Desulfonema magnum TaxID=45655 RepID=A0A975GRW7_9BACT|nr:hypothetical protein [Desulfonema magnum]QTA91317.1 Uncharacterized protein dnm_073810 [Desulfonema magnum]
METQKSSLREDIEKIFQDIGGFTWEQAESWSGFCHAVGMEPIPYLKVMLNNVCNIRSATAGKNVPSSVTSPELWIIFKHCRTRFKLIEPE